MTDLVWLGLNRFPHDKHIAVAMMGWMVGKLAALRAGPEATRTYCQLNTLVLAMWIVTNYVEKKDPTTSILPAVLFGAYLYAGFVEE